MTINGTSLADIISSGSFVENFYEDSTDNPMTSITITGNLTFLNPGTAQERPSWNFNFKGPADPVNPIPEPSSLLLIGAGLLGILGYGWRRRKKVA